MRSKRRGLISILIIGLLAWATVGPQAQVTSLQPVSPFDIVGFIEAATLNPAGDGYSGGGTITVNGTVITVPSNTMLQMPAFALTWQEVFSKAPAPYFALGQSGLAMSDGAAGVAAIPAGTDALGNPVAAVPAVPAVPAPMTTHEVHIQGNRVGDNYIAGLMFIAQQSLNNGAGFINYIDYSTPGVVELRVGGLIGNGATGARVRINDPAGKFGPESHIDDRFTIDEDNPTVRSETGYPMCLPRTQPFNTDGTVNPATDDPLCPQLNRPKGTDGNYLTKFTMDEPDYPGAVPNPASTCTNFLPGTRCNPLLMMPFEVGDYVDYNGNLVVDAAGTYVNAWGLVANVGVLTAPGTQPAYTVIETMVLGVGGVPVPGLPQEAAVRTRIEGFTTDPTSFIDLFATDVDACSGAQTLRYYATIGVDNITVFGRWRWRPNTDLAFQPPTRMLTAVNENGIYSDWTTGTLGLSNGLLAGFYTAPNFEFIFPENLPIGNPPVPNNFVDFPFLTSGSGPYPSPASSMGLLSAISPWPGAVAPAPLNCDAGSPAFSPTADAGLDQSVQLSTVPALVTLDGGNSRDHSQPLPLPLTYSWTQDPGGARVALVGADTATPTFEAPLGLDTLTFTLTVSNGMLSSSDSVSVVISAAATPTDAVTITSAVYRARRAQLFVTASTTNAAAVLTVEAFGDMGAAPDVAFGVPAPLTDRAYRQIGVAPIPVTVTVRSSLGGIATLPVTVR